MTAKKNSTSEKEEKRGRVKVGQLQRNLEAPTDLTGSEQRQVKGGRRSAAISGQIDRSRVKIEDN